ncbi:trans-aconitate 2-methyltransferase, partial [Pseudovibrio sp. Ad37]|uniref:class I SAM-dependent methyltransferase n=1 Tax=Pseudovibrio sp. Ad37 TaxID=989422 RepID=UPI000A4FBE88
LPSIPNLGSLCGRIVNTAAIRHVEHSIFIQRLKCCDHQLKPPPLAVLDISSVVLEAGKERLGGVADDVEWINADITNWTPDKTYQVWHDRAVFHFLTEIEDQKAYVNALVKAVPVGGTAIISSFAEDGPEKCSGLPVQRYSSRTLAAKLQALAPGVFAQTDAQTHTHITPKKNQQNFQTSAFKRVA